MAVYTPPIVFSSAKDITNPRYAEFIDGPYLDSRGTDTPVTVSGTTGDITVTLAPYLGSRSYALNEVATDGAGNGYASLVAANVGNALPAVVNADWALLPVAWDHTATYALGAYATNFNTLFKVDGVPTVYYSIQAGNINNALTDTAWWSTQPPTRLIGTTYDIGVVTTDGVLDYISLQAANVGNFVTNPAWWLPVDFDAALRGNRGLFRAADASDTLAALDPNYPGYLLDYTNTGRVIRLKVAPQPWSNLTTYAIADTVTRNGIIYTAAAINTNSDPTTDPVNWTISPLTVQWVWGSIKHWTDYYTATVTIKSEDLRSTDTVYEYRLGTYSATTGWPTSGTYHEGRLILNSCATGSGNVVGYPNRIDMGQPNLGFAFAPTAPDGTVADNNGITMTLNAADNESIQSLASTVDGIAVFSSLGEWNIAASNLNDPITPTSAQAKRGTTFTGAPVDNCALTSSHAFIQGNRRRLLEYKQFVDMTAYQVRPNGADLTKDCQHLTVGGIAEVVYQKIPQPVIWCLGGRVNETTCKQGIVEHPHTLFGIGYTRNPDETYIAPFSVEHGYEYLVGGPIPRVSIAVQYGGSLTKQYLYCSTSSGFEGGTAFGDIEIMDPPLDTAGLDADMVFITDKESVGTVTDAQKLLASGCFLDRAIQPAGAKLWADGTGVTFYGMWPFARQFVTFTIMGKRIGSADNNQFLVNNDGTVDVPFSNGASTSHAPAGDFSVWDVNNAAIIGDVNLADGYQAFVLDPNGTSYGLSGYDIVADQTYEITKYMAYFGLPYRRRGRTLRPLLGSQNGPTPFGKTVRNARMALSVDHAHEISIGSTFPAVDFVSPATLAPLTLTKGGAADETALGIGDLTSGIFRDNVTDDYGYDGTLCWEQTEPYPGAIIGVGGFYSVDDV